MKKWILMIVVVLLSTTGLVQAEESDLGITLDVTYVSRYIFRGFDFGANNHGAIQPSIDIDLWGTGFGVNVWYTQSNQHVNDQELDFTIYYGNTLLEGERLQTDYTASWVYYSYPDTSRSGGADQMDIILGFAFPNICDLGIVPSYTYIYAWQADGGNKSGFRKAEGSVHVFGLGYGLTVPGFLPDTAEQVLDLSVAAVYNDGSHGATVKHDWSHIVWGISTGIPLADNLTFTPGLYYQTSMEESVNTQDEYWTSLSMTYTF